MAELFFDKGAVELKSLVEQKIHELYEQNSQKLIDYLDVLYPKDMIHGEDECKRIFAQKLNDLEYTKLISVKRNGVNDYTVSFANPKHPVYISLDFNMISYYDNSNREICRFSYQQYEMAAAMLEKLSELLQEVENIEKDIPEKYLIPYKSAEIAKSSLQALFSTYYAEEDLQINCQELTSEIYMRNKAGEIYYLKLIHKSFLEDTKTIVDLVKHPEEKKGKWFTCLYIMTVANSMPIQPFIFKPNEFNHSYPSYPVSYILTSKNSV